MDGGAWWATVHGVAKSQTQLSDFSRLDKALRISEKRRDGEIRKHKLNEMRALNIK